MRGDVETLEKLRGEGHLYDADGALWMRTTDFGDDKDRVLIRSNGELTYFASDTAYYLDKRGRGFDRCVYLLGADHHGYVGRLRAMAACAGDDPDANIEVLIGQLVKIMQGGEELKLSKRAGTLVTLRELIDLIGVDALRYTLARYPADSPLTLDAAEMTRQASDNPVFYVQYAHARVSSILRNAEELGLRGFVTGLRPSSTSDGERVSTTRPARRATHASRRRGSCCGRWRSFRGWCRGRRGCGSRTGWRGTSRRPRRRTTGSTTPAGSSRWGTRSRTTCTVRG